MGLTEEQAARWVGEPEPIQDSTMNVVLSAGLKTAVRAAADAEGVSQSMWARQAFVDRLGVSPSGEAG